MRSGAPVDCDRFLANAADLDQPRPEVARHLDDCPSCRAWRDQLRGTADMLRALGPQLDRDAPPMGALLQAFRAQGRENRWSTLDHEQKRRAFQLVARRCASGCSCAVAQQGHCASRIGAAIREAPSAVEDWIEAFRRFGLVEHEVDGDVVRCGPGRDFHEAMEETALEP